MEFSKFVQRVLSEIEQESYNVEEIENLNINATVVSNIPEDSFLADSKRHNDIHQKMPLTDMEYLSFGSSMKIHNWCSRVARISDCWTLDELCHRSAKELLSEIERTNKNKDTEDESARFQLLRQMHFIQLIMPSISTLKTDWLHTALSLSNLHHLLDSTHRSQNSILDRLDPSNWATISKRRQLKKIPLNVLYSMLSTSLTASFHHKSSTIDSITLLYNIIQKDLRSSNKNHIISGLKVLTWFPEVDLVSDNLTLILGLIGPEINMPEHILKKIIDVTYRVLKHRNNTSGEIGLPHSQLVQLILMGLKSDTLYESTLRLSELAVCIADFPIRAIVFSITGVLSRLVERPPNPLHDYHGIWAPWVQIKALRVLAKASVLHSSLTRIFFPLLVDSFANASSNSSGIAVVIECVKTLSCMSLETLETSDSRLNDFFALIDKSIKLYGESSSSLHRRAAIKIITSLMPHRAYLDVSFWPHFLISEIKADNDNYASITRLYLKNGFVLQNLSNTLASETIVSDAKIACLEVCAAYMKDSRKDAHFFGSLFISILDVIRNMVFPNSEPNLNLKFPGTALTQLRDFIIHTWRDPSLQSLMIFCFELAHIYLTELDDSQNSGLDDCDHLPVTLLIETMIDIAALENDTLLQTFTLESIWGHISFLSSYNNNEIDSESKRTLQLKPVTISHVHKFESPFKTNIETKKASTKRTIHQVNSNWDKFKKVSDLYHDESKKKKEKTVKKKCVEKITEQESSKQVLKEIRPGKLLKGQVAPYLTKLLLGEKQPGDKNVASIGKILAIDCEMVGVGKQGHINALARISIVNYYGTVILDTYVSADRPVTDYRTWVSGITPANLKSAPSLEIIQSKVKKIFEGKILVGHDLQHDLKALKLTHPIQNLRDTAYYKPFLTISSQKPSLKKLVKEHLGLDFQDGSHSSIEDALATLVIYRKFKRFWEADMGKKPNSESS